MNTNSNNTNSIQRSKLLIKICFKKFYNAIEVLVPTHICISKIPWKRKGVKACP